ncbi:LOW QUALITY PROTEIN: uncharacterized protein LOC135684952 [Rhopilema esculentum]|uniref:LOW QUALITY PROTEIN: uncharacterized protein LOC135684952 n=1 Tax=Rhopilema esculentum TaxID=499914 RepID=UPI0031D749F9
MKDRLGEVTMNHSSREASGRTHASRQMINDLETKVDVRLSFPNMEQAEKSRRARAREAMEVVNPSLAHKIISEDGVLSREDKAAVHIQRMFRGYLARKRYFELLYEKFIREEAEMEERRRQQVEEGELLIENHRLEHELEDKAVIRRNRARSADAHATTIQRAWKRYKRKQEGIAIPDDPINIGRAEDGYNEEEFPYYYDSSNYRMRNYEDCDEHGVDINDIFDDSLEYADHTSEGDESDRSDLSDLARSFPGDYLIDDEFNGKFESMDLKFNRYGLTEDCRTKDFVESTLPEPTTDWNTIESVLTNESGVNSPEDGDIDDEEDLSRKLSTGPNLQLVFVDDDGEDTDNESDPEVKVYIVDDERNTDYIGDRCKSMSSGDLFDEREIDSRDSGCVPGDLVDLNIDYVTDYTPNQLSQGPVPAEESKRVLYSLQLHEEHEKQEKEKVEEKKRQSVAPNSIYLKLAKSRFLQRELEDKVQLVSNELVDALMARDSLHAEQESLLMEVEDLSK